MKRMPHNSVLRTLSSGQLQTLSELVARSTLAYQLGYQYGGDRDLYQALGYETGEISYEKFYARYRRQDIAKAIIDRPVIATWQGPLEVLETNDKDQTPFEKAWIDLDKQFGLKTRLSRVDRLTRIGRYGVLLLGLDDVKKTADLVTPVTVGKRSLMYVKPFGENSAKIKTYNENSKNSRYGLPEVYSIEVSDMANGSSITVDVHHSRVIHVVDDNLESEIYGTPALEPVYNRLMDLEKVIGGDAEMFWRGARPGYQGIVDKDTQVTTAFTDSLKDQIDEFEHNLRRILVNEGVKYEALAPQISDPVNHVQVLLQMISSETGIPIRVLVGSERGELASSQDRGEWLSYVQARRREHAEPRMVRLLVDRLIQYGILPKPTSTYWVAWEDIFAQSEKERVEIGKGRANALREYTYNILAQELLPKDAFFEFCLGFTADQIELVNTMSDASSIRMIREEEEAIEEEEPEEGNIKPPMRRIKK